MINKTSIKRTLQLKKATDYSYTILFFLSFSFFTFFVIRPNIVTILSLQEEAGRLKILDAGYENVIRKIVDIQTFLETNRENLYLLDESLPSSPNLNKIVDDTQYAASGSALNLTAMTINKVDLKDVAQKTDEKSVIINIEADGTFIQTRNFISEVLNDRRLKNIRRIVLDQDTVAGSSSGNLKLLIDVEGYHL